MRRTGLACCLGLVGFLGLGAAPAHAGLIYSFDKASYTVPVGGKVSVQVFLQQTPPTTILTDEGLFSAGVKVSSGAAAQVLGIGDILANPAFDDVTHRAVVGSSAELSEVAFLNPTVFPPPGGDRILLGTFTFTGLSTGVSPLSAGDLFPSPQIENVTGVGTPLDALIGAGTANINVTPAQAAVPEPTSLLLLSGGLLAAFGLRSARRRTNPLSRAGAG